MINVYKSANSIESIQASIHGANSLRDGRGNVLNDRKLFRG